MVLCLLKCACRKCLWLFPPRQRWCDGLRPITYPLLQVFSGVMGSGLCLLLTLSSRCSVVWWGQVCACHLPSLPGGQWCDCPRSVPVTYPLFQVFCGMMESALCPQVVSLACAQQIFTFWVLSETFPCITCVSRWSWSPSHSTVSAWRCMATTSTGRIGCCEQCCGLTSTMARGSFHCARTLSGSPWASLQSHQTLLAVSRE